MPKITLTYESEDKIPAELKQFANGTTVSVWANKDDLSVAGELNPQLEANRNTILEEKRVAVAERDSLKTENEALKKVASDDSIDKAKVIVENETLKKQIPSADDVKLLQSVKTVFKDTSVTEIETKLPTLLEASSKAEKYEKREQQETLFNVSGYKNKTVFFDFINNPENLTSVEGDPYKEKIAGSDKEGLFVKVKDANGVVQPKLFTDYLKEHPKGKDYLPALMNGTTNENQKWFQQNPPLDGQGDKGTKPAWQARVEEQNKKAQSAPNAFVPNLPKPEASGQGTQ